MNVSSAVLAAAAANSGDDDDKGAGTANDDPQLEEACLFLAVLSCLVCCCFSTCIVRRLRRLSGLSARYLSAELTQPLLDDTDHETFLTADDGWVCPACDLKNRSSRSACDICGLTRTSAQQKGADLKRAARKALGWDEASGKTELPPRQRRCARRRRWTRSDGTWQLSSVAAPEPDAFAPPLVMSFYATEPKVRLEAAAGADASVPWRDDDHLARRKKRKHKHEKESSSKSSKQQGSGGGPCRRRDRDRERDEEDELRPIAQVRRHRSEAGEDEYSSYDSNDADEADDLEAGLLPRGGGGGGGGGQEEEEEEEEARKADSEEDSDDDDETCDDAFFLEDEAERLGSTLSFGDKVLYFEKAVDKTRTRPTEGHARLEVRRSALLEESVQQLLALDPNDCKRWMRVQFVDEPGIDVGGLEREWFGLVAEALFDEKVGAFRYEKSAGSYAINPTALLPPALGGHPRADELFEFTGRFVGKAVLEHVPLGASLSPSLWKQLLGRPLEHDDLQDLDETLAQNVQWLLSNDGIGDLDLDFSVAVENDAAPRRLFFFFSQDENNVDGRRDSKEESGRTNDNDGRFLEEDDQGGLDAPYFDPRDLLSPPPTYFAVDDYSSSSSSSSRKPEEEPLPMVPAGGVVRELVVPRGRHLRVDDVNKRDYARRLWRYHLFDAHRRAAWHLAKGLYSVLPAPLLLLFDEREFDLLVCGSPQIDVDDWADNTDYAGDYRRRGAKHTVIVWFWKVLRDLDHAHRAKLLQYCTGSNRLPCHGFKALQRNDGKYQKFSIHSLPRNELRFPRAHTCFNRLDLPLYSSKNELEAGLKVILAMDTTGFTMD